MLRWSSAMQGADQLIELPRQTAFQLKLRCRRWRDCVVFDVDIVRIFSLRSPRPTWARRAELSLLPRRASSRSSSLAAGSPTPFLVLKLGALLVRNTRCPGLCRQVDRRFNLVDVSGPRRHRAAG